MLTKYKLLPFICFSASKLLKIISRSNYKILKQKRKKKKTESNVKQIRNIPIYTSKGSQPRKLYLGNFSVSTYLMQVLFPNELGKTIIPILSPLF